VSASRSARGAAVFERAGRVLPDEGVEVLDASPSAELIGELAREHELFVFVGHGVGSTVGGGSLVLMNDAGEEEHMDLFTGRMGGALKEGTGVVLSACETAWDGRGHASMMSISATLLAQGAGFVLGSQWWVSDTVAPMVSVPFVERFLSGADPEVAFAQVIQKLASEETTKRSRWGAFCLWLGRTSLNEPE